MSLQSKSSYEALKRNGLSDSNIAQYYSLPNTQRSAFLSSFKNEKPQTQKCTLKSIKAMADKYMVKTFRYRGKTFNPTSEGWTFSFNNRKRALGLCNYRYKEISLSKHLIESGSREFKMWENTMIHEIAHAFAYTKFGESGHGRLWKDLFISLGGDGNRTSSDVEYGDLLEKPVSKYTLICDNCGKHRPSYKKRKRACACPDCCKKYNNNRYSDKYKLREVQNY